MTARALIDSICTGRMRIGESGNIWHLTPDQLNFLLDLIAKDKEASAVQRGTGRSLVWMPSGRFKYIVTEDLGGHKHTLTRLPSLDASGTGSLF